MMTSKEFLERIYIMTWCTMYEAYAEGDKDPKKIAEIAEKYKPTALVMPQGEATVTVKMPAGEVTLTVKMPAGIARKKIDFTYADALISWQALPNKDTGEFEKCAVITQFYPDSSQVKGVYYVKFADVVKAMLSDYGHRTYVYNPERPVCTALGVEYILSKLDTPCIEQWKGEEFSANFDLWTL